MCSLKVSIIVPVYNGEKFISDTIWTLLGSSLHEIEVIVIDDGSQDDSIEICRKIAKDDDRVKIICQDNTGVAGARNHGLQVARGEFICFCDQDDVVEQKAYERMYETAQKCNCDVVMASTGKLIGNKIEKFEKLQDAVLVDDEIIKYCLLPILFNGTYCYSVDNEIRLENDIWKCMIKRSFILENNLKFRHFVNYEDDFLFLLDILARAKRVTMISDMLYYWRVNLQSETYNTAYVDDLYAKDICLQREITDIMRIAGIDKQYIEMYEKCQNCNRYIHMIENENIKKEINWAEKIQYIKQIQRETVFEESLAIRKTYKKNLLHRRILLAMLEKHFFTVAYLFHKLYFKVRKIGLRFNNWTRLENYLYDKDKV